ncbi:hypothetical protein R1sor_015704 [Riccia sorocarpa]|uniref:Uncharacterized protein n=1 Tax=Riccia sorocarpa TaxID=122646 RepID=A0ABD3HGC0_9MARC
MPRAKCPPPSPPTSGYNPAATPGYNPAPTPGYNPAAIPGYNPAATPGYNPPPTPGYNPAPTSGYNPAPTHDYNPKLWKSGSPEYNLVIKVSAGGVRQHKMISAYVLMGLSADSVGDLSAPPSKRI